MKTLKQRNLGMANRECEDRWAHPLLGLARFLGGTGFWLTHAFIVAGLCGLVLIEWFDATINEALGTLATMTFGIALLFAFAGWIARYGR